MPTTQSSIRLLTALALCLFLRPTSGPAEELQLVALHAASPTVIGAVLHSRFLAQSRSATTWPSPSPDLEITRWRINGDAPARINRYSHPIDALPEQRGSHPVKVEHIIYLSLEQNLREGSSYRVDTPYGSLRLLFSETTTRCAAIKVNQGGYHPGLRTRYANAGVFLGDGGSHTFAAGLHYSVRRTADNAIVHTGTASYWGDDRSPDEQTGYRSGEHVYRLALSQVPPGGPYFVSMPDCGRSADFHIGMNAVQDLARLTMKGIYHQRCGVALLAQYTPYTRAMCAASHRDIADIRQPFATTAGDARGWINATGKATTRTVTGGWHDAGDFDRRVSHLGPLSWWLSYFEALQSRSPWRDDGWLNIPESGNRIPDFLDEASWALRAWRDLQLAAPDSNQGALLAGTEASGHPVYGRVSAASDTLRYGSYGISPRATAWAAGAFAHMARLWQAHDTQVANDWLQAALMAWRWLEARNDSGFPVATAYAAMQLYLTTGRQDVHDVFKDQWTAIQTGATQWPEQCLPQNASAQCQLAQFAMYFHPRHQALADPALRREGLAWITWAATNKAYHCVRPEEAYPQCLRAWGDWGRQVTSALRSDLWVWAWILLDDHPLRAQWFDDIALLGQFATGLNPLNRPFYTGLGPHAPRSSTHLDSYFTKYGRSDGVTTEHQQGPIGQVPGLLIFGPGDKRNFARWERAVTDKLFPAWDALPRQRRWADGWSAIGQNEVLTTNMAYQTLVYLFLASVPAKCTGPSGELPTEC